MPIDAQKKGNFVYLYEGSKDIGVTNYVIPILDTIIEDQVYLLGTKNSLWRGIFIYYPNDEICHSCLEDIEYDDCNFCPYCGKDINIKSSGLFYEFPYKLDTELVDRETIKFIREKVEKNLSIPVEYKFENGERIYK